MPMRSNILRDETWYLKLVFQKEIELSMKRLIGIDIGIKKLFATSDRQFFFTNFERFIAPKLQQDHSGRGTSPQL